MLLSVLTRTKDRPDLLDRVLDNLLAQTRNDFVWIVANDGAESGRFGATIARARATGIREVISQRVSNSRGMETASNQAVAAAKTKYVTLLDDDDTWEPTFIEETLAFLDAHPEYGGVCTQSFIVTESDEPTPTPSNRKVMNPDFRSVTLAELSLFNQWTTNAFVYRRDAYEDVGPYREDLPVLGDWEFNLRFLLRHHVGVIPRPLANYHRRIPSGRARSRTPNTSSDEHVRMEAFVRNELFRDDVASGRPGIGFLLAVGQMHRRARDDQQKDLEARISALERRLAFSLGWSLVAYPLNKLLLSYKRRFK